MAKNLNDNVCKESIFAKIYDTYSDHIYNFLYFKFGERLNPEDKMQEAFIKLWKNCKKVPPEKAKSFLFTVANNLMLNEAKHEKVVLKYQKQKRANVDNQDPQFLLEEEQYLKKYEKALASLTEAQRTAFLMNRVEGKKHKEIAEELGISRKAVEKRIYSALKKLRKDIKEL
ncbi:RNA polymerase sigma factor [Mesonia maritima]|uniref:RNA polymerase sigma-70 factor (ECF subfamily) n=1 Tax=Mesonia maritima TaxID=1793873 RepID=A0ABU1K9X6_9FLAO|nr:sigma-70 family RNA polymerase sigma factor [Mesonia maritima]MDR6301307.1 RNA polymerase sigma-70 factor (ECF subfamily) [Mesonia maritima]